MDKKNQEYLDHLRHSCAHLLAAAVMELWPETLRTIGPSIENGFYYDFDFLDVKISEGDLLKIEQKMHKIVKSWDKFERIEVSTSSAVQQFSSNPYKLELIKEFSQEGQKLTLYKSGNYVDLCRGGHIEHPSNDLKHFKLLSIAGAYWRGSEKNKMLARIYGTCFPTQKELDDYLKQQEEAKKRDHRVLGKTLDLFSISQLTGPGLILWHPKLAITRNIVEQYWKNEHYKEGYQLVFTPHIASMDMFVMSRHYNKYINSMFPAMLHEYIEGESRPDYQTDEQLKPMNCPNHIQIYKFKPRSYRELPIRMGELGTVYRYERAGTLLGMTRVRGFTQDDSHIFCTPQQVIDEVRSVIKLTQKVYKVFGFSDYQVYIATRPQKYLGTLEMWDFAENALKKATELEGLNYKIEEGEGVFYGPKIDSKVKDSLGREWQLGTIQFDFNQPSRAESTKNDLEEFWAMKTFKDKFKTEENLWKYLVKIGRGFDVKFVDKDGEEKQVVMIHRTILGSMERFFGLLIEHYSGNFPTWLAPVQVKILPISDKSVEYSKKILGKFKESSVRTELDSRNETLQAKIRGAQLEKIPYMVIIGEREEKTKKIAVRERSGKNLGPLDLDVFISEIKMKIETRSLN
ncbi:hypothetical protein A3A50_04675 [Candidatus Woesebacteria bacterium RIFCSPLOWO2_01_FULL_38_20]|nr:MAG: hypothetical protein A3A50_04675 [Candidatus Woesebacteria bacterium RIFCSPLOWO2_01_FULL_38_20]